MKKTEDLEVRKFEVNELTKIQGGYFITIEKKDGTVTRGVNVKSIKYYLGTTIPNSLLDGNEVTRVYFTGGGNDMIYENGKFFNDKWIL
jgi:hypothetical protein